MSATLKSRVGTIIAGGLNALVDRLEAQAPEAVMAQVARETDAVLAEVRAELGKASASRHLAQQQHASLNSEHAKLTGQIEAALGAGRDDLAKAAVGRQLDIEAQLPVIETTLAELAQKEDEFKGYIQALLGKKRQMEAAVEEFRRSRAAASAPGAASAPFAAPSTADGRVEAIASEFDRLYSRHAGVSIGAASTGMGDAARLKELDDLSRENKIAERLASLKGRG